MKKPIRSIDMDNVVAALNRGIARQRNEMLNEFKVRWDEFPGIFQLTNVMARAVQPFPGLSGRYDASFFHIPTLPQQQHLTATRGIKPPEFPF